MHPLILSPGFHFTFSLFTSLHLYLNPMTFFSFKVLLFNVNALAVVGSTVVVQVERHVRVPPFAR